ncbi:putative translation initiation factor IF-2 [Candidatus Anstonella stagnisolia]|nr:putative translation initiation factor IF-2 [Candidatus Anstonella stagnisolia]
MGMRQPIVAVMGHVDHGKTSLLDRIRETSVAKKEAGAITQHIGASEVKIDEIHEVCSESLRKTKTELKIPGLLFIDTPGHESFTNLRERGGSIADIAILVVDVMQGFQPQTVESIKILRNYKTPFVVAANKIDMVNGWKAQGTSCFLNSLEAQNATAQAALDNALYNMVGKLGELGIQSERFDRVEDFTKQIGIVPVSAKTGEGISELLLFIAGLSQKFLEQQLRTDATGPAKGSILEVKEEKGIGTTLDVIIYDGELKRNDTVVFGTINGAAQTKVRGILRPNIGGGERFASVESVCAAAGVKIFGPGMEDAVAGSPILGAGSESEEIGEIKEISEQIRGILFSSQSEGVVLKADTLGSLEALLRMLKEKGIPVKETGIGKVTKRDVVSASAVAAGSKYVGVVLSFNVPLDEGVAQEAEAYGVKVFESKIVYALLDDYDAWIKEEKEREKKEALCVLALPAKIRVLPGCTFRESGPAIFGVEVLGGKLRAKCRLMNRKGDEIGTIKLMQHEKKPIEEATRGMQVAISVDGAICGKSFEEGEVLYTMIGRKEAEELSQKCASEMSGEYNQVLSEILAITSASAI